MTEITITVDGKEYTGTPLGPPARLHDGELVSVETENGQRTGWIVK